jgi:hypothetical protein
MLKVVTVVRRFRDPSRCGQKPPLRMTNEEMSQDDHSAMPLAASPMVVEFEILRTEADLRMTIRRCDELFGAPFSASMER